MSEDSAFLEDIRREPDNDGLRLIYADWLEDHGKPERAEFIRNQIVLASGTENGRPLTAERQMELEQRDKELLDKHSDEWGAKELLAAGATEVEFRRGFPGHIAITANHLLANADSLFEHAPLESVRVTNMARQQCGPIANLPVLRRLRALDVSNNCLGPSIAQALAESPYLSKLTDLNLANNQITSEGVRALASSRALQSVRNLDLTHNEVHASGAMFLAASRHFRRLEKLNLSTNSLFDDGANAIALSPHLTALASLNLRFNLIRDAGAEAIAGSPNLARLKELDLYGNSITDAGARSLLRSLRKLEDLNLAGNCHTVTAHNADEDYTGLQTVPSIGAHTLAAIGSELSRRKSQQGQDRGGRP